MVMCVIIFMPFCVCSVSIFSVSTRADMRVFLFYACDELTRRHKTNDVASPLRHKTNDVASP
jgi:hypothetical protein